MHLTTFMYEKLTPGLSAKHRVNRLHEAAQE